VVSTFQAVSENLTNKHREQGELEETQSIKAKLDTKKEGRNKMAHLKIRAEDLATMKNLFRSRVLSTTFPACTCRSSAVLPPNGSTS
jgi:hypothetical protein